MRENYKGFTLVELLAIIVILTIIALITTPVILNVIEKSRLNAAKDKAWGTIDAVRIAYATAQTSEQEVGLPYTIKYPKTSASDSSTDSSTGGGTGNGYINNAEVKASGENPTEGTVTISNNGTITASSLKFDNYYCSTINGKNGKLNPNKIYCSRMSDDVVSEKAVMMAKNPSKAFWHPVYSSKISTVDILTNKDVPNNAVESWDVSEEQNGTVMAWIIDDSENSGMYKLYIGGDGGVYAPSDSSYLFMSFNNAISMNLSNLDTSKVTSMTQMFLNCTNLTEINVSGWDVSNVTSSFRSFFSTLSKLTTLNVSNWNMGDVTDMSLMFSSLTNLKTINMKNFKTPNITDMSYLFSGCKSLETIDLSSFDTSKVTDMNNMFYNVPIVTLNLSNWSNGKITDMSTMFAGKTTLKTLKLNNFKTTNVTNMYAMFAGCTNLTSLDLYSFDTSKVTNMLTMFSGCTNLTSLDLCSFDTSKVTNMYAMFASTTNLKYVNVGKKWTTASATTDHMFDGSGASSVTTGQC